MFKIGKTYRHEKCLDLDINILELPSVESSDGIYLSVRWFHRFYGYYLHDGGGRLVTETILVKISDLLMWKEANDFTR